MMVICLPKKGFDDGDMKRFPCDSSMTKMKAPPCMRTNMHRIISIEWSRGQLTAKASYLGEEIR